MAAFRAEKVVSTLPATLEPDTVYYVRTGDGFDVYVSDATGNVAHGLNTPDITPGDPWTLSADNTSFTYDGDGAVTELTESVGGEIRTTTYTYNGDGLLTEVQVEFRGVVRTETFTYVDEILDESTAVITEAA